jgi:hypothetical protein
LLALPYWLIFEWLAPIIEFAGILYYIYLIIHHAINWPYALIMLLFVYTFSVAITITSVLWDEITRKQYASKSQVLKLCSAAFLEPFVYHPLVMFFALRGNFFFFSGRKLEWGDMIRQGFTRNQKSKK